MDLNQEWTGSVLVYLTSDVSTETQDVAIPNGLGTWRRQTHSSPLSGLIINFADVSFERKIVAISQPSTSNTGSSCTVTFAIRSANDFLRDQQVFALSSSGKAVTVVPTEERGSFSGVAGFVTGYHCDKCKEINPEVVLIIAFGVRGPFSDRWCCVWICAPHQAEMVFEEIELLQSRFGWNMTRGPLPGCGKEVVVSVFQDEIDGASTGPKNIINIKDK